MEIAYSQLKKYIDFDLSPQQLAEILTSIGLEVGSVEEHEAIKGGLQGVVVGKVLTCTDHPNSDHLHITTVDLGEEHGTLQIVCGAPNIAANQVVPVATIGTTLYSGEEAFKIKKGKIRGEESFGMICSEVELGIGNDNSGILVLPNEVKPGTPMRDYLNLQSETIIEVDITPNRSDAASYMGVARDLYAYLKVRGQKATLHTPPAEVLFANNTPIALNVTATEGCLRYCGVVIKGVKVQKSPDWLCQALTAIGQKPINNVVDITNFVLFETGQPLHAFDLEKVGNTINVRYAKEGEELKLLDGTDHKLTPADVVIANATTPMCLAGVMGGTESGVTEATQELFLEAATFHPTYVRKSARRHGVSSDSSFRFERGLDPKGTDYALSRAASLILEICGGEIASAKYDVVNTNLLDRQVELSFERVRSLTGVAITNEEIIAVLEALQMPVLSCENGVAQVSVPLYRYDVTRDVDLVEEILRIYGYDKVTLPGRVTSNLQTPTVTDKSYAYQRVISDQLVGEGYNEILNNSLSKASYYASEESMSQGVEVLNALSSDLSTLRQTLLYGGLESISYNQKRRNTSIRFFEFGNTYTRCTNAPEHGAMPYNETFHLALWLTGDDTPANWALPARKTTPYDIKATVEHILARMGVNPDALVFTPFANKYNITEGIEINTRNHKHIGYWGIVNPKVCAKLDIDCPVYFAQLEWNNLVAIHLETKVSIKDTPKYPSVRRDFALLVDSSVTFADIQAIAQKTERKLLQSVALFDVYENPKHLPPGKKSYAVTFELRDKEKTLSDKTIQSVMNRIYEALHQQLGAELR